MTEITYWVLANPETGERWDTYDTEADAFDDQEYLGDGVVIKIRADVESGLYDEEYLDD